MGVTADDLKENNTVIFMLAAICVSIALCYYSLDHYNSFANDTRFIHMPLECIMTGAISTFGSAIFGLVWATHEEKTKPVYVMLAIISHFAGCAAWIWEIVIMATRDMTIMRYDYYSLYALIICHFVFISLYHLSFGSQRVQESGHAALWEIIHL